MKKLILICLPLLISDFLFAAPFYFRESLSAANGNPAIYLAKQQLDLSADPDVSKAVLSGNLILLDGGHSNYTLTLPYEYKGKMETTTLTLRRHGILFGLSHTDDSDRTGFPNNVQSLTPFSLIPKSKDRYQLKVARDIVQDPEMKKAMKAIKLSRDGMFAKNKFKVKIGLLRMIKEANFEEDQQREIFEEIYEE
jgi:hypothetical protein